MNPDQSRKVTFVGTYVTTGGTGKLKRLKGVGRFSGFADFNAEGKATRTAYSSEANTGSITGNFGQTPIVEGADGLSRPFTAPPSWRHSLTLSVLGRGRASQLRSQG